MVEETINRFDIYLVKLNPTVGSEIQKTRPCIVISPNEMNLLNTVFVAPMTSKGFDFIFRPKINFDGKKGLILLDQIRTVDKSRFVKKIGVVDIKKSKEISSMLVEIFKYWINQNIIKKKKSTNKPKVAKIPSKFVKWILNSWEIGVIPILPPQR